MTHKMIQDFVHIAHPCWLPACSLPMHSLHMSGLLKDCADLFLKPGSRSGVLGEGLWREAGREDFFGWITFEI